MFCSMFVIDYLAAFVFAVVLAVIFAPLFGRRNCHRLRDLPSGLWLLTFSCWGMGILVVVLSPVLTGTHWVGFTVAVAMFALLLLLVTASPAFRRALARITGPSSQEMRAAIALFFVVTMLLFFSAISVRFYIVHLS